MFVPILRGEQAMVAYPHGMGECEGAHIEPNADRSEGYNGLERLKEMQRNPA